MTTTTTTTTTTDDDDGDNDDNDDGTNIPFGNEINLAEMNIPYGTIHSLQFPSGLPYLRMS